MNFFRKSDSDDVDNFNNHVLLNELKCFGCAKFMKPPILQCAQGHSCCEECGGRKATCLDCNAKIINTRNLHLESISQKVKYPCIFYGAGCKEVFLLTELKKHEEKCCYRMQSCRLGENCTWTGSETVLESHVLRSHPKDMIMKRNNNFVYKKFIEIDGQFTRLLKAHGHLFWYHHYKNANEAYWAIQFIGVDLKAAEYCFDFRIVNPYDEEKSIGYKKVSCLRIGDNPWEMFIENKSCVFLSLRSVQNFMDVKGNILCHLSVRKCGKVKERAVKTETIYNEEKTSV